MTKKPNIWLFYYHYVVQRLAKHGLQSDLDRNFIVWMWLGEDRSAYHFHMLVPFYPMFGLPQALVFITLLQWCIYNRQMCRTCRLDFFVMYTRWKERLRHRPQVCAHTVGWGRRSMWSLVTPVQRWSSFHFNPSIPASAEQRSTNERIGQLPAGTWTLTLGYADHELYVTKWGGISTTLVISSRRVYHIR